MKFLEELEGVTILGILVAIGVAAYLVYDWFKNGDSGPTDAAGQTSSLLGALRGTGSIDPTTGQSTGTFDSITNFIVPQTYPGGGEVAGTSETPSGALDTILTDPIGSFKSIFGIGTGN